MKEYWRKVIVAAVLLLFLMHLGKQCEAPEYRLFFYGGEEHSRGYYYFFLVLSFDSCLIMSGTHDGPTRKGKWCGYMSYISAQRVDRVENEKITTNYSKLTGGPVTTKLLNSPLGGGISLFVPSFLPPV